MGSGESRFNVSLIVRDKVTGQRPQTTTFEGKREPKRIRTEVLLLTSPTRLTARLSRLAGHYICHTGGRLHRSLVQLLLIMTMDDSQSPGSQCPPVPTVQSTPRKTLVVTEDLP